MGSLREAVVRIQRRRGAWLAVAAVLALSAGPAISLGAIAWTGLHPNLPYRDLDRLVALWREEGEGPPRHGSLTGRMIHNWTENNPLLVEWAAFEPWERSSNSQFNVHDGSGARRLRGARVTPNFFDLLGVSPMLGTVLSRHDVDANLPVAVLSESCWRTEFDADPRVIGRRLRVSLGRPWRERLVTIVGVLPPAMVFTYPLETQMWVSMSVREVEPTDAALYFMIARLRRDVGHGVLEAELTARYRQELRDKGYAEADAREVRAGVESLVDRVVAPNRAGLTLLHTGASCVALIGAVSLGLLLMSRTMNRRAEFAIRQAQGASRTDLLQMLCSEALVLGAIGLVAAAVSAVLSLLLLSRIELLDMPGFSEVTLWEGTLRRVALAGGLATALAAVVPACVFLLRRGSDARATGAAVLGDVRTRRFGRAGVAVQAAGMTVLLVAVGLLGGTVRQLRGLETGFDATGLVGIDIPLSGTLPSEAWLESFRTRLMEGLKASPALAEFSLTSDLPLDGTGGRGGWARPVGTGIATRIEVTVRTVDDRYFGLLRLSVLRGRVFGEPDDPPRGPFVAVIDSDLATRLYGTLDVLGRRVSMGFLDATIVGVTAPLRYESITREPEPVVHLWTRQRLVRPTMILARPRGEVAAAVRAVRDVLHAVDPTIGMGHVTDPGRAASRPAHDAAMYNALLSFLTLTATAAAAIGIAFLVGREVGERRREIGIRCALGAQAAQIVILFVRGAVGWGVLGIAAGVGACWATAATLRAVAFGVSPFSGTILVPTAAFIISGIAASSAGPALLAVHVDAADALRRE